MLTVQVPKCKVSILNNSYGLKCRNPACSLFGPNYGVLVFSTGWLCGQMGELLLQHDLKNNGREPCKAEVPGEHGRRCKGANECFSHSSPLV